MTIPTLEQSADRLALVDDMIFRLIRTRMSIAADVAAFKRRTGESIFRSSVEDARIERVRKLAEDIGLNPHFAASMLYLLIDESCKQQMIQIQSEVAQEYELPEDPSDRFRTFRHNLIELTRAIAGSYNVSTKEYPATVLYLDFEKEQALRQIKQLGKKSVALDLGCGAGRMSSFLGDHFETVIGYDLSQHMVATASNAGYGNHISFEQIDLEEGIPLEDKSVSFVICGLGTASDIRNSSKLMHEVSRVLQEEGRFLFSFYNKDALMYHSSFLPWETGLAAQINLDENCLTVHLGGKDYRVYAKAYSYGEIEMVLAGTQLHPDTYLTHPTITSIVPSSLLRNKPEVIANMGHIDAALAWNGDGAYYLIPGLKR